MTAEQVTEHWIADGEEAADGNRRGRCASAALRHALGYGDVRPAVPRSRQSRRGRAPGDDAELERELRSARFTVKKIAFTPFDAAAAAKVRHFETYNRTQAGQRVADIVAALDAEPGAAIVASGDAALAALLAAAIVPPRLAVLDVGAFDTSKRWRLRGQALRSRIAARRRFRRRRRRRPAMRW